MDNFSYKMPPLEAIKGFVAVGRRMSITLAAQDLFLTQSAVSRQIQTLEEYLGVPLFVRGYRAIAFTEAGQQLFDLASPWLSRLLEFAEETRSKGKARPITITANMAFTSLWILPKIGAFQALHPQLNIRVAADNRVLNLEQEGVDLAVRYCRAESAPANAIRLFGEEVIPVASKSVAARAFSRPEALFDEVFLELDEKARPWLRWSDWLTSIGSPHAAPRAYMRFNQYDQVVQAAIQGHGVALGRLALVLPMLEDGRLVAQPQASLGVSDYAYWLVRADGATRAEVDLLAQWLVEEIQQTSDLLAAAGAAHLLQKSKSGPALTKKRRS